MIKRRKPNRNPARESVGLSLYTYFDTNGHIQKNAEKNTCGNSQVFVGNLCSEANFADFEYKSLGKGHFFFKIWIQGIKCFPKLFRFRTRFK